MGLSDPRLGPLAVMCSRSRLPRAAAPLPGRVSQVPRLIFPCALPPSHPGKFGDCLYPLLHRRCQASSLSGGLSTSMA